MCIGFSCNRAAVCNVIIILESVIDSTSFVYHASAVCIMSLRLCLVVLVLFIQDMFTYILKEGTMACNGMQCRNIFPCLFLVYMGSVKLWCGGCSHACLKCFIIWRAQWKKGITVFDDPKRSNVNKAVSLSSKLLWLTFNSWICVLLKSSLVIFLDTKNVVLTFDLLGLSKTVIPFSTGPFNYVKFLQISFLGKVTLSNT